LSGPEPPRRKLQPRGQLVEGQQRKVGQQLEWRLDTDVQRFGVYCHDRDFDPDLDHSFNFDHDPDFDLVLDPDFVLDLVLVLDPDFDPKLDVDHEHEYRGLVLGRLQLQYRLQQRHW
jgi:hypothetical protein